MEKDNNKNIGFIILILILSIVVCVLSYFLFINKDVICKGDSDNNVVDKENNEENSPVELSVENPYVNNLYSYVHFRVGINKKVFDYTKRSVSEMSDYEKSSLAANIYSSRAYPLYPGEAIDEADVKYAYELVFGEGTYKTMDSISFTCGSINYNSSTKRYEHNAVGGCGGTSTYVVEEAIIKAVKYSDRIEVVAANVTVDFLTNSYIKDGKVLDTFTDRPTDDEIATFIKNNSNKLQQYTYTFMMDKNGFYYYVGFERTQE